MTSPASRPANLLTLFQAHFHVRRGNELTFTYGHDLDLSGVEWKVLPSGSHAVDQDVIWFEPPGETDHVEEDDNGSHRWHKVGMAVFKNRKLTRQQEENGEGEQLDERGARMVAIGLIIGTYDPIDVV